MAERDYQVGDEAPPPLEPRSEKEILAHWDSREPVVSILCATYNHEEFIDDAMKGFLGQVTTFPFEIIVRDDASTDGTLAILRRWEKAYPRLVRVVVESTNTYAVHKPFDVLRPQAKGEFIAVCEGDDYWIDSRKLEEQVDYLSAHPECAILHHQAMSSLDGLISQAAFLDDRHCRNISGRSLQRGSAIVTGSIVHRNIPLESHPYLSRVWNGDQILLMRLGYHGEAHFLPGPPRSVYRLHGGGVWSRVEEQEKAIRSAESFYWIAQWFAENRDFGTAAYCLRRSVLSLIKGFSLQQWAHMKPFPRAFAALSVVNFRRALEWFQRVTR